MTNPQRSRCLAAAFCVLFAAAAPTLAGDWPQWRGPNLDGSADEPNVPVECSETKNVAWRATMPGPSGATPIVVGERVFVVSAHRRTDSLIAMCLGARDGKELWEKTLARGRAGQRRGEVAACSPVSDGQSVWFLFGTGAMIRTDLEGKVLWQRDLVKDYGCLAIKFGYSASPLLLKGRLYLPLLRREKPYADSPGARLPRRGDLVSYVLCYDARTGKKLWAHRRDTDAVDESRETYATIMPIESGGRTELIVSGGEYVTGHDAETGKELWRWEYGAKREIWQRIIASPVTGCGLVFACRARGEELHALKPGKSGKVSHDQCAWRWLDGGSDVCTPLVYGENLYLLDGDEKKLTCFEARTGKIKGQATLKAKGPFRASPTGTAGRIYCISEGGDYIVLSAADEPKELYRFATGSSPCRSSIVAAHGSLYLRLADSLWCLRK